MEYNLRWVTGLFKDASNKQSHKDRLYLTDIHPYNLLDHIIISRNKVFGGREIREYAAFRGFPDLFHYMKKIPLEERLFHEVTPEDSMQKPRFDIDIKINDYVSSSNLSDKTFVEFGEMIKDMVISAVMTVTSNYGLHLDLTRDFMIFTAHGKEKRSYHIVLNRYYHHGHEQSRSFYDLCCQSLKEHEKGLYKKYVDPIIYNKNASLRLVWCIKKSEGEIREKKYCKTFNYRGKSYTHLIDYENTIKLEQFAILANSLITFTCDADPMPIFPVTKIEKNYDLAANREISDIVYKACKNIIEKWDTNNNFEVGGCDKGVIQLYRNKGSYCSICTTHNVYGDGLPHIHEKYPSFCYINQNVLYWHCGKAKGISGIPIGYLDSSLNNVTYGKNNLTKSNEKEDDGKIKVDGTEVKWDKLETKFHYRGDNSSEYTNSECRDFLIKKLLNDLTTKKLTQRCIKLSKKSPVSDAAISLIIKNIDSNSKNDRSNSIETKSISKSINGTTNSSTTKTSLKISFDDDPDKGPKVQETTGLKTSSEIVKIRNVGTKSNSTFSNLPLANSTQFCLRQNLSNLTRFQLNYKEISKPDQTKLEYCVKTYPLSKRPTTNVVIDFS